MKKASSRYVMVISSQILQEKLYRQSGVIDNVRHSLMPKCT